jgi:hypothetical protein
MKWSIESSPDVKLVKGRSLVEHAVGSLGELNLLQCLDLSRLAERAGTVNPLSLHARTVAQASSPTHRFDLQRASNDRPCTRRRSIPS